MSTPRDIQTIEPQVVAFINANGPKGSTTYQEASRESSPAGNLSVLWLGLMESFAKSLGIPKRKLLPDDFYSDKPLSAETEAMFQLVKGFFSE